MRTTWTEFNYVTNAVCCAREENACRETITSNCYCYAINKIGWSGGYCMPGYRKEGDDVNFESCSDAVRKVEKDGAVPVSRRRVYSAEPPAGQHYIAMVLWPGEGVRPWACNPRKWMCMLLSEQDMHMHACHR
jgi:hypothetical protein